MKAASFLMFLFLCLSAASVPSVQAASLTSRSGTDKQNVSKPVESDYVTFTLSDFTDQIADCQERLVRVTAEVISVDFSRQLIRLYDARARKMLEVSIAGLPRASRRSLLNDPVMRAEVFGKAVMRNGRLMVNAHKIIALVAAPLAQNTIAE